MNFQPISAKPKQSMIVIAFCALLKPAATVRPTEDYSGREQYLATTKGDPSHEETRSKIGYRRVLKEKFERVSLFLCLFGW